MKGGFADSALTVVISVALMALISWLFMVAWNVAIAGALGWSPETGFWPSIALLFFLAAIRKAVQWMAAIKCKNDGAGR